MRQTYAIVGCSEYVTRRIQGAFPQYADRCVSIYNGVDIDKFTIKAGRPADRRRSRVIFVGRLTPEKGLHVFINAFERVLSKCPEAHLEIIGANF